MHHPKLLRSKCLRSAIIPAAVLCVVMSGCADQQPVGPTLPSAARTGRPAGEPVPFNKFFVAWSQNYIPGPIQTQIFALDVRQDRQYGAYEAHQDVLSFAKANPGRLYINGDEQPDQWCFDPYEYAGIYRAFVVAVRGADPTARVSPAGFAEPNERCCPPEDAQCHSRMHSIGYAAQFYDAYIRRFGVAPPVDEWRFHDFGLPFAAGDLNGWWSRVDGLAAWSVSHGANMVLGAWGFLGWRESLPAYQEHMKQAMGRLLNDPRINGAAYWSYKPWVDSPRYLVNDDGSLTAEGQTHANPMTDTPTAAKIVGSANGHAKLRWSNTTSAWAAEVEFWVQAPGSDSFVYHKTELVAGPGANQTPSVVLNTSGSVKARVRYYNVYGPAAWSSFSNSVLLALAGPEGDQRNAFRNSPHFCFLKIC